MKKLFALAIISTLLFSGCGLFDKSSEEESTEVETYKEAIETGSTVKCGEITDEEKKEECKNEIKALQEEQEKLEAEEAELAQQYVENKDLDSCYKLTVEVEKNDCVNNIMLSKALETLDPSHCENIINDEELIKLCKGDIGLSEEFEE